MAKKKKNEPVQSQPPSNSSGKKSGGKNRREPLTEEEIKRRKESRTNVTSSVSWTGKLPHNLLHENCQKQKWDKVEYDMKKLGDKGFVATALISYTEPKTKEKLVLRMGADDKSKVPPQATSAEARHFAATVALHRIAYNSKLYLMLPPNHKSLWYDLEDDRKALLKEDPVKCARLYDEKPFESALQLRKTKEEQAERRALKEEKERKTAKTPTLITSLKPNSNVSSAVNKPQQAKPVKKGVETNKPLVTFPRKVWETTTFFDFTESSRKLIENALKTHIDWTDKLYNGEQSVERENLREQLLAVGFRPVHVDEAMAYKDPLSFLICNLPEDDLPHFFHRRKEESMNTVEIAKLPLNQRNMIDNLCEMGTSKEESQFSLEQCDYNEAEACLKLMRDIYPVREMGNVLAQEELEESWNQEFEALKSIYGPHIRHINENCYIIELNDDTNIKVKIYRTKGYPNTLPGIIISTFDRNVKLPNYVKLTIMEKLLHFLDESQLVGDMCVYHIIDWLEQHLSNLVENPGPLLTKEHLETISQIKSTSVSNTRKRKHAFRSSELSAQEKLAVETDYKRRMKSDEYQSMKSQRANLPAWKVQDKIVNLVENNDVVLITGETGSGKSTQVVQFVLDSLFDKGNASKTQIICTQPRRISAIGLAERVSHERCTECGEEVGYIIRGVNLTKKTTRIKFMTTGILVRILQGETSFLNNSIVVIDEVHERSLDTDLIIILLKNLMKKINGMKLILMSATVNVDVFKGFFKELKSIHIEGRTFPIKDFFLDDVLSQVDFKIPNDRFDYDESNGDTRYLRPSSDSKFFTSGQINYDLISETVKHVDEQLLKEKNDGSIIVFLPGVGEINRCCTNLTKLSNSSFVILPLHSALSPDDQKKVFRRYKSKRKIIVSTNIAETSITIDDCVATIDTGRVKTLMYDAASNTSKLVETFVSKAEAKQRRGRAGRVRSGYSYKLFSKNVYESMDALPTPEIKRVTLESLYLSVRSMGVKNVPAFLKEGLDSPPTSALAKAEHILTTTGLLEEDKSLSELGRFVSLLPVMDSKHGKLLIYSIIFGCTDIGVLIASVLSVGTSVFINEYDNRDKIRTILKENERLGDVLAVSLLLKKYIDLDGPGKRRFLKDNLLSYNKVTEIMSTLTQFYSNLKDIGFLPFDYKPGNSSNYLNRKGNDVSILQCLLCGSFYPNIARVQFPESKFVATGVGALEKDQDAKLTKYWIRNEAFAEKLYTNAELDSSSDIFPAVRAFIHPSSLLFNASNSASTVDRQSASNENLSIMKKSQNSSAFKAPFVIFNSTQSSTKLYLRGVTPTSTISVLLFGGPLSYNLNPSLNSPNVVIDNWSPIRLWCKNGVLIKELKALVDKVIAEKLDNPHYVTADYSTQGDDILRLVETIIKPN